VILTGRTALVALICALPVAVSPRPAQAFAALLAVLAAAICIDAGAAASPRALRLHRSAKTSVRLGEPTDTTVWVHNRGRRRFRGQVRDAWPPSACAAPAAHHVTVGAGQTRPLTTRLRPTRRGDHHAAAVTARSLGPLRLAGRQQSRSVAGQVRVLPPFLSRKHLPSRLARLREIDGASPALIRGHGTEFDSLREYVVGDDVRSIDWRATARLADVVVRTWRPERDRRVVIVVDTGRIAAGRVGVDPTAGDPAGWPRMDWSLDAALLLAALASRAGDRVDFLAHDRVTRAGVFRSSGTELLPRLVDAMAGLHPTLVESDYAAMVSAILRRVRRRALVVLLSDLNPAALDEGLLPVLSRLSARHQVLLAAVADPRIDQLAGGRSDVGAVYDAAAAERSRNERQMIASRLRQQGADVVDAAPEELAPALADRYLAMKAGGRL
jgi:uncharacterized protein (DUF58 family)